MIDESLDRKFSVGFASACWLAVVLMIYGALRAGMMIEEFLQGGAR